MPAGNLYLLTEEYVGAPSGLSGATPGHLATSTGIVGGFWSFDTSVFLNPGTMYWFYSDALFTAGSITGGSDYPGGAEYVNWQPGAGPAGFDDPFWGHPNEDANFQLSGTAAPVPEPTSLVLFGTGAIVALTIRRRLRRP